MGIQIYIVQQSAIDMPVTFSYLKDVGGVPKLYCYLPSRINSRSSERYLLKLLDKTQISRSLFDEWKNIIKTGAGSTEFEIADPYVLPLKGDVYKAIQEEPDVAALVSTSDSLADMVTAIGAVGFLVAFRNNDILVNNEKETMGYLYYQDTSAALSLTAATWTDLPNNGAGAETTEDFAPNGITSLLDAATGKIDANEMSAGDVLDIVTQLTINPSVNNAVVRVRVSIAGISAGSRIVEIYDQTLDNGSGVNYTISPKTFSLPLLADDDLTDIKIQVYCSVSATVNNNSLTLAPRLRS